MKSKQIIYSFLAGSIITLPLLLFSYLLGGEVFVTMTFAPVLGGSIAIVIVDSIYNISFRLVKIFSVLLIGYVTAAISVFAMQNFCDKKIALIIMSFLVITATSIFSVYFNNYRALSSKQDP